MIWKRRQAARLMMAWLLASARPTPAVGSLIAEDSRGDSTSRLHDTRLNFAGAMWQASVDWAAAQMPRPGVELASADDLMIPRCVDDADQAIVLILQHHAH